MKKTIFLTLILLLSLHTNAQNSKQTKKILDKTAAVVGHKGGATAHFSMSGKYGTANGTISIKGNKFAAQTSNATIWFDGKTQWTYNKKAEEVNISTPTQAKQQSMNPYTFINIYKTGFNMSHTTSGGNYQVHLTAQNQKRTIKELYITINNDYQPTQVKMRTEKGWSVIKISNFKKANLSDATFQFNAKDYPHAEVIDLR